MMRVETIMGIVETEIEHELFLKNHVQEEDLTLNNAHLR